MLTKEARQAIYEGGGAIRSSVGCVVTIIRAGRVGHSAAWARGPLTAESAAEQQCHTSRRRVMAGIRSSG
jgi:hypothetical protein